MLTIRAFDFTDDDYTGIAAVHNITWTETLHAVDSWRHLDQHQNSGCFFARLVAEIDNTIVAFSDFGESCGSNNPHTFFWRMDIHPDFQRHNVATVLYSRMTSELLKRHATLLTTTAHEHQPERIQFLHTRGYVRVPGTPVSGLGIPHSTEHSPVLALDSPVDVHGGPAWLHFEKQIESAVSTTPEALFDAV